MACVLHAIYRLRVRRRVRPLCISVMETNEIREKIITSAQKKMVEVGIRSVSIDDICHELGMSKKTFYVYFSSKDDLIEAILDFHYEEVRMGIQNFLDSQKSMWDAIRRGLEKMISTQDVRKFPPFIYDLNKYYPETAKRYNARILALNRLMMQRAVERGIGEGIFRAELDVEQAALMLARLHDNIVQAGLAQETSGVPFHQLADFTLDVVLRGLLSRDGLDRYEQLLRMVKGEK